MKIFITSDSHFGHPNILKYEAETRPFSSIEEHDEELIKRWNSVVSPSDEVFHGGDFCFWDKRVDPKKYTSRLNGKINLIRGNHDKNITKENYQDLGFARYSEFYLINNVLIVHYPIYMDKYKYKITNQNVIRKYEYCIHGHVHTGFESKPNPHIVDNKVYINVSCEKTNLTPIPFNDVFNLRG